MNSDETVWSRTGDTPINVPTQAQPAQVRPTRVRPEHGAPGTTPEERAEPVAASGASTRDVLELIFSAPSLALAAFAFSCAQLVGGLIPEQLVSMIPGAADSPANHVRIVSLFDLGMAGIGATLAAAAIVRRSGSPRWVGWLAGAAVVIACVIALQSVLLIILSTLAPPGTGS